MYNLLNYYKTNPLVTTAQVKTTTKKDLLAAATAPPRILMTTPFPKSNYSLDLCSNYCIVFTYGFIPQANTPSHCS